MSTPATADQLAQSALDVGVISEGELRTAWEEAGTGKSINDLSQALVRKGYLTNYQLDRLSRGMQDGYFYGDYKVLYNVGSGSFARVFRAVHRMTGELYAVKVLRSRHNADPKISDFFRREGELGKTLKHKNIVPIHEVVSRPNLNFLVMDFIEGRNLREFYRVRGKFEWSEAGKIMVGTLAGLHYAFGQGITHRDLKLSNVLVSSEGESKLIDFGLAALDSVAVDEVAGVTRTVEYAALEKATNVHKDDNRSDVFFAGYMLHQMLTGTSSLPEGRERNKEFNRDTFKNIKPLMELEPSVPMPIAMVVSKAMELDPERRYQTPGDMLNDLRVAVRRAEGGAAGSDKKQELASQEGIGPSGLPRKIMIVESSVKRQDLLRDLFKRNGYRVLISGDIDRALDRFVNNPDAADVVVFCAASLGAAAVDAFNQFGDDKQTADKAAILLLEESQSKWVPNAKIANNRGVGVMPMKLRDLRKVVLAAINASES